MRGGIPAPRSMHKETEQCIFLPFLCHPGIPPKQLWFQKSSPKKLNAMSSMMGCSFVFVRLFVCPQEFEFQDVSKQLLRPKQVQNNLLQQMCLPRCCRRCGVEDHSKNRDALN